MRVERTAVVFGRAVLVSRQRQLGPLTMALRVRYLLAGSCFLPCRRSLLRAIGSKLWTRSLDGGGTAKEDESSTSWMAPAEAWRRREGRAACTAGRSSVHRRDAERKGSSRRAMAVMMGGGACDGGGRAGNLSRWRRVPAAVAGASAGARFLAPPNRGQARAPHLPRACRNQMRAALTTHRPSPWTRLALSRSPAARFLRPPPD